MIYIYIYIEWILVLYFFFLIFKNKNLYINKWSKKFTYNFEDETPENRIDANSNARINPLKLSKQASIHEKPAIEAIINITSSTTNNNLKILSEMHVISSYIHSLIRSTFDSYEIISYCSNLLLLESSWSLSECTSYISDRYIIQIYVYLTAYENI